MPKLIKKGYIFIINSNIGKALSLWDGNSHVLFGGIIKWITYLFYSKNECYDGSVENNSIVQLIFISIWQFTYCIDSNYGDVAIFSLITSHSDWVESSVGAYLVIQSIRENFTHTKPILLIIRIFHGMIFCK